MQVNLLSQDNSWRHKHHKSSIKSLGRKRSPAPTVWRIYCSTFHPSRHEKLSLHPQRENREPAVQESETQEISPGEIKYRLEPLSNKAPLLMQPQHYFSQHYKSSRIPYLTTYQECYKPWKKEPACAMRSSPIRTVFQSHPLGQLVFPVDIQDRKTAAVRPGYMEYGSRFQRDYPALQSSQLVRHDPDNSNQMTNKATHITQKDSASGGKQPTVRQPQESCLRRSILGERCTAKVDEDTAATMLYLPPPKSLVKRVLGPSRAFTVFKTKIQNETPSKQFSQVCKTQPQGHNGEFYSRGCEKALGMISQAPDEAQATSRNFYMPLFAERVNLCQPKANSSKYDHGKHSFATEQWKYFRSAQQPESRLQKCLYQQQDSKLKETRRKKLPK
ncbi:uncharacterized protein LOC132534997 [Erinaceus europaeus]|uniref:Uncharacterized protein LOC132534997 n=1 Tax=Erinaceus europaeus TaxID=9365 RepID=A0ABM3WHD5_ERIEU|nr:uncharacterized protein LOC132534997 [Erinaceus europaeus]